MEDDWPGHCPHRISQLHPEIQSDTKRGKKKGSQRSIIRSASSATRVFFFNIENTPHWCQPIGIESNELRQADGSTGPYYGCRLVSGKGVIRPSGFYWKR